MARITVTLLVFLLLMNGSVTIMEASGLNDDLGITLSGGVDKAMDTVVEKSQGAFNPSISITESIINLILAGISLFAVFLTGLYAMPTMLINLGIPSWFVIPVFAPAYILSTAEIIYIATGRKV